MLYILIIIVVSMFFFHQLLSPTNITMKYFPIDQQATFEETKTALTLSQNGIDQPLLIWESTSQIAEPSFLRHDASLLFQNGQLKGIQSKWIQEATDIRQTASVETHDNQYFQSISYHYSEIHSNTDQINSNHQLSSDHIYVIDDPFAKAYAFKNPESDQEQHWASTLNHTTAQQLDFHWTSLIDHFNIDRSKYYEISLLDWTAYQYEPLPQLTLELTKRVTAQLWEGLYKHYIIPFKVAQKIEESFVPLILLDKNGEYLFVLFQDVNGDMQQLVQQIH